MRCSKCGLDGFIQESDLKFEGDESPNTATKAYRECIFTCRNPNCSNNGKEIGKEKIYLN